MKPFERSVYSKYGAPMGRRSDQLNDVVGKVRLQLVPFVDGCYDQGGAYWGSPQNLFCAWGETDDEQVAHYLRASDRSAAKDKLLVMFPKLKFYR